MILKTQLKDLDAYRTKDGSIIIEMMHPSRHGNRNQSLAQALVASGTCTRLRAHAQAEELYFVEAGQGIMTLGSERFEISVGDTIQIQPGEPHCLENIGEEDLVILCCSSPPYSDDDTELLT